GNPDAIDLRRRGVPVPGLAEVPGLVPGPAEGRGTTDSDAGVRGERTVRHRAEKTAAGVRAELAAVQVRGGGRARTVVPRCLRAGAPAASGAVPGGGVERIGADAAAGAAGL